MSFYFSLEIVTHGGYWNNDKTMCLFYTPIIFRMNSGIFMNVFQRKYKTLKIHRKIKIKKITKFNGKE